ncbi:MAG: esterase [Microbacteriaceae bacterium]|nr:esterase [Microbacteriaceae bacterium]
MPELWGPRESHRTINTLLLLNIVDGTVVTVLVVASLAMLVYLVSRRMPPRLPDGDVPRNQPLLRRWIGGLGLSALGGAIAAIVTIVICEVVLNLFGTPIELDTHVWVTAAFAAAGIAVFNIWKSRWWRKVIASVAVVLFLVTASLGINASYGLNTTVASLLNIETGHPLALPSRTPLPTPVPIATSSTPPAPPKPLWQSWVAPAGMPATGQFGTVVIPNTASGFVARPAYLYLPPAALVANPPALPILIMMMGQPGGPDYSSKFLPTLNSMAAANRGLGAIVLTIDQIGSPTQNPLCIDSAQGNVHTYIMNDVLNYVRNSLHVAVGRTNWAIGGYSNGGECALSFGAQYPGTFGSILDVSGEIGPSLGSPENTLKSGFGGDQSRFDAEQPLNIMARTRYSDMLAIFTSGANDHYYGAEADRAQAAATAAGMTTRRFIGPGVGHRSDAIVYGVPVGLAELYPRWELSAPAG